MWFSYNKIWVNYPWFPPNLKNTSWNWRLFIQALIDFHPGFFKQIGNGFQTNAYNDPWLIDLPLYLKPAFINVSALHMNKSVSLIRSGSWNFQLLSDIFAPELVTLIASLEIIHLPYDDLWIWKANSEGKATAKSAYRFLKQSDCAPDNCWYSWQILWKLPIAPKIQIFCWKLLHKSLPTTDRLHMMNIRPQLNCPPCNSTPESINHLFF